MLHLLLTDLVVFGSLTFWIWCTLWSVIFTVLVQRDHTIWTGILLVILTALYFLVGHHDPSVLWTDPTTTLGVVAGYIGIGVLWSVFRWYRHLRDLRKDYDSVKEAFLVSHGVQGTTRIPDNLLGEWRKRNYYLGNSQHRVSVKGSKGMITAWMILWPFSVIGWVLNDPINRLITAIFDALRGIYTRIMERAWGDVSDDFRKAPPKDTSDDGPGAP